MKKETFDLQEKTRNWNFILYEENEKHLQAVQDLLDNYCIAGIKHDKDTNEQGEIKKAHFHIVLKLPNARTRQSLCNELDIEPNMLSKCKSLDKSLEYLIHLNDSEKYQYGVDCVFGDMVVKLKELVNNKDRTEGEKIMEIFNYIDSVDGVIGVRALTKWVAVNGYWAEFRRSQTIMLAYLQEHNEEKRMYVSNN